MPLPATIPISKNIPLVVLGIDPGYDRVGWAIGEIANQKVQVRACGCIETDRTAELFDRYRNIDLELEQILSTHQPSEVVIESLFFFRNTTTALAVSEARGVMISRFLQHNLTITEYTPLQIKETVTGYGKADKKSVEKMVQLQTNLSSNTKRLDDTLDAVAALLTHASRRTLKALTYQHL